jgi:methionyl-tRNA formyltransferase
MKTPTQKEYFKNIINFRPRLIFFTHDDPFYVIHFFDEFLRAYPYPEDIIAVVITKAMGENKISLFKRTLEFFGLFGFIKLFIEIFISKFKYLSGASSCHSLTRLFKNNHIKIIRTKNVNNPSFILRLARLKPALFLSVAFPQIFRKEILKVPSQGAINIHHSLLPEYRGMLPTFWQLYHGKKDLGITVHQINERIDDGKIIIQESHPIIENESFHKTVQRTKRLGAHTLLKAIDWLFDPNFKPKVNCKEAGSYYSFPSHLEIKKFRKSGFWPI